jgi:tRNA-dihydrouridine synthase A
MDTRFSVAPMVGVTTPEHRHLCRLLSSCASLYTEMVVDKVLFYASPPVVDRALDRGKHVDGRVVLQLAGNEASLFSRACALAEARGFDEVNLNCGCPAKTASKGAHGLSLMRSPRLVAEMVAHAVDTVSIPVTVKCRTGVDELNQYEHLEEFVRAVAEAGAARFVVHARPGLLKGLGTKANRTVPPLQYEWVGRLVDAFPGVKFDLNGGVESLDQAEELVRRFPGLDGVMLGRAVWHDPLLLAGVDERFFPASRCARPATRRSVLTSYLDEYRQVLMLRPKSTAVWDPLIPLFAHTPVNHRYRTVLHEARSGVGLAHLEEWLRNESVADMPLGTSPWKDGRWHDTSVPIVQDSPEPSASPLSSDCLQPQGGLCSSPLGRV